MARSLRFGSMPARMRAAFAILALAFGIVSCDCDSKQKLTEAPRSEAAESPEAELAKPTEPRELVVFAASSLARPFEALEAEYESAHPGTELVYHFAGTQELRTQIEQGAKADVFASADERYMTSLVEAGLVDSPVRFATNQLVIAVHSEAKAKIQTFSDLARPSRLVLGAPEVPIGRYSELTLDKAASAFGQDFPKKVLSHVISRELNVKQVLAKVQIGEADAGIVYQSDLGVATPSVSRVVIPVEFNVIASYPVAIIKNSPSKAPALAFIELLRSPKGQRTLAKAGFGPAIGTAPP